MTAGDLIRETRRNRGLSQARLALRAGTKQSAISRLEAGEVSPSVDTLRHLLNAMGEDLVLSAKPLAGSHNRLHRAQHQRMTPDDRLALGLSWTRLAGRMSEAGRRARAGR
jgi:transcriptional regulator with XRE-family HTH domain